MNTKILIIGACGQIGTELTMRLRSLYGIENVVASDIRKLNNDIVNNGIFEVVNALDYNQIEHLIEQYQITDVYLMAALLSATAEKNPAFAWDLNMNSLFHVLNLAKAGKIKKIFWPSSIAVFGPTTPRENTPQYTIMDVTTSTWGVTCATSCGQLLSLAYHHDTVRAGHAATAAPAAGDRARGRGSQWWRSRDCKHPHGGGALHHDCIGPCPDAHRIPDPDCDSAVERAIDADGEQAVLEGQRSHRRVWRPGGHISHLAGQVSRLERLYQRVDGRDREQVPRFVPAQPERVASHRRGDDLHEIGR